MTRREIREKVKNHVPVADRFNVSNRAAADIINIFDPNKGISHSTFGRLRKKVRGEE